MKSKILVFIALMILLNFSLCEDELVFTQEYGYASGGADWKPELCTKGESQSPIDIPTIDTLFMEDWNVEFDLKDSLDVKTEYNSMMLALDYKEGSLSFNKKETHSTWQVKGVQFHAPGEHKIDGFGFDLEMHVVFQNDKDARRLLVVAVPFIRDKDLLANNDFINQLNIENLNQQEPVTRDVKFTNFFDELAGEPVFAYKGSLTLPP